MPSTEEPKLVGDKGAAFPRLRDGAGGAWDAFCSNLRFHPLLDPQRGGGKGRTGMGGGGTPKFGLSKGGVQSFGDRMGIEWGTS